MAEIAFTTEHDDHALTLDAHQCVLGGAAAGAAQFGGVAFVHVGRCLAHQHEGATAIRPSQGRYARTQRVVAAADEGVHYQCFEPRIPGATGLSRTGVDLCGGKGHFAGVHQHGFAQFGAVVRLGK